MAEKEFGEIQTADPEMNRILLLARNVAPSKATVLICGESGTGKELLARYVHSKSPRATKRFVAVNCAAVPEGLLESELFGYEKGAFTGAGSSKPGKFELAHNSTFLLDEISEMPLLLQAKLLRVIQEGEIERLGAKQPQKVNVRLIATTNRNLVEMVKEGSFREDLYYRLNVIPLNVPPLRSRPRDVEMLSKFFLEVSSYMNGRVPKTLSEEAAQKLLSWNWPGNVRELENVIERSVLLSTQLQIQASEIFINDLVSATPLPDATPAFKPGMTIGEVEKNLILQTLEHTKQNRTRAAELLGISIRTLRNKLNEYGTKEVVNG
jgi:two-component system response regulator FlrC